MLAGAFYGRITKIILPGGAGIEIAALTKAAHAMRTIELAGQLPSDASPAAILEAIYIAASHGADLSKVAQAAPAQLRTIRPLEQPLSAEEIARLQTSGTPPDDLWVKLAKAALVEVSKEK